MLKKLILFFLLSLICCTEKEESNLYVISNISANKHLGDRAQSISIQKHLKKELESHHINANIQELDIKDLNHLSNTLSRNHSQNTIISSGEYGINAIKNIKQNLTKKVKVLSVWSGHHIFDNLWQNAEYLDVIIIPEYNVSDQLKTLVRNKNIKLIPTQSIPSSTNYIEINNSYTNFRFKNLISKEKNYLVVFLGGDAPSTSGEIKNITDKDIKNFAQTIKKISIKYQLKIVITNSPRTKQWQTDMLLSELQKDNSKSYTFFDFHSGVRAYKPLLNILNSNPNNVALITGESTSMVDEVIQIQTKPIYIFKANNMSNSHLRHSDYKVKNHQAILLDSSKEKNNIPDLEIMNYKPEEDSASVAAKQIIEIISK
ncbi:MAG: mitochondrial fission ELM1 family protein [Alphaproteobacteria bacterium]|nr:mitochondrial fission ELM1 family protein [Alphaproteobacteria bacterium]